MAILVTRPQPDNDSTAAALRARGFEVLPAPMLQFEAVAFHEAVPGHHSQLARAAVLRDLPLLQQMSVTAHSEGWGLYAERLAGEFGLYSDERAELGAVYIEMHRAARLVVDTGMHAQSWTRERAIAYAMDTLGYSEARARNQIERYMVMPAQALSYKIGALKILELRERARQALGEKFTYAKFHDVVIGDGTLPLPLLEARVDAWIAREK